MIPLANQNPLKGWRKILAALIGGGISVFFPAAAPIVLPLVKTYILGQAAVDTAESLGLGPGAGK